MADEFTYEKLCEYLMIAKAHRFKKLTLKNVNFPKKLDYGEEYDTLEFDEPLTSLPNILFEIDSLEELDLSGNQLSYLSARIGKLINLHILNLAKNRLKKIPNKIGKLSALETLDLSHNRLSTLPSEISRLVNLISLELSNNDLKALPIEFGQLQALQFLRINNNDLGNLPQEFFQLTNLLELEISKNRLNNLSSKVKYLRNLQKLLIGDNLLSTLPPEIGQLQDLRVLDVSENRLTELPRETGQLKELRMLFAGNRTWSGIKVRYSDGFENHTNHIKTLPPTIGLLTNLTWLELVDNELETIPKEIKGINKLEKLFLKGNRLSIPPEILDKTDQPQTILNYYFSIIQEKRKSVNETKLLLVGQGSVGKTSIVQQILHGTFDQNQTKTEGISINQWTVNGGQKTVEAESPSTVNDPSSIKLNIWDFGGQEIMHATHQFFLTKRSLYLLVLDSRLTQEENRVEYWLKIIQSFGGESPVLIVGNKTDQHLLDIDRTGLQKKYPNVVGVFETSAATGAGIAALKAEIAKQVDTLPHVRDLLPETWFTVKTKLENLGRETNFITHDDYDKLCDNNDVHDETSQHALIGFLHDLGVVLYFQDDPRLESLGILNPQWVTNGVYKILNSHELFQNQGKLTLPLLNQILNTPEYPGNKRLFIVDMMKKFELCYDIEPDKSFLIPDLLPKDEPYTGEWDGALAFQIHYNVLPSSIISRFIVRMNAFIHKTVWRSGVVLKREGNTALVKADTEDRKIYIWVADEENTRRDFLSAIRMEFEAIHKTITKIEASQKVPHPDYPELVLDYDELIEFERQGVNEFPKKVGDQVVKCNVRELLDGIRPSKTQTTKVFISYSHQDKSFVKKLAGELEDQGMKVWWDFDNLKGGQDWQKEIEKAIKQCDFFLVALTPDAITSEWVGNEITYANQALKTIIPLHLKKCDIPIGLIKRQYIDFEKQTQKAAIKELMEILHSSNAI